MEAAGTEVALVLHSGRGFTRCAEAFLLSEHTETQMCGLGPSVVSTGKRAGRLDRGTCKVLRKAAWTPSLPHGLRAGGELRQAVPDHRERLWSFQGGCSSTGEVLTSFGTNTIVPCSHQCSKASISCLTGRAHWETAGHSSGFGGPCPALLGLFLGWAAEWYPCD